MLLLLLNVVDLATAYVASGVLNVVAVVVFTTPNVGFVVYCCGFE